MPTFEQECTLFEVALGRWFNKWTEEKMAEEIQNLDLNFLDNSIWMQFIQLNTQGFQEGNPSLLKDVGLSNNCEDEDIRGLFQKLLDTPNEDAMQQSMRELESIKKARSQASMVPQDTPASQAARQTAALKDAPEDSASKVSQEASQEASRSRAAPKA
ncbi:unnamed protein product, partial [Tilletia caries]